MSDFHSWLRSEFQQIYIFTVLAILLALILITLAHGDYKAEVETLLNVIATGLVTMMGAIVSSIFNGAKSRAVQRSGDGSAPSGPDTSTNGGPSPTPATQGAAP